MGFYGNITNTSKTQFNFDRIYPNRKAMDDACKADGVALGRFVLVEYGETDFDTNYNKDKEVYGIARGYDSTVWQKVYVDQFEKYVMIAELNSVVPTFDISVDAPTSEPQKPHFDADNTNVYYKLHVQPSWGMRVAAAEDDNYSDETDLNIYYNKKGFDVNKRNHDDLIENKISITEGASGQLYNICDPATGKVIGQEVKNDVKEISIMLPALGNTISNIWDTVYGQERNLDINWDSKKGLRLVEIGEDGYSYDKTNVQTLAGCINSVHDLMGMIIEDEIPTDTKDYSDDVIYYKDGKYYRKFIRYDYDTIADLNELGYESIGTLRDYIPNTYFTKDATGDYYLSINTTANRNRNYYNINAGNKLNLSIYKTGQYYYKDNNNYILDMETVASDKTYYSLDTIQERARFYKTSTYFYKNEETENYTLDKNETMTSGRNYYTITGGTPDTVLVPIKDANNNIIGYEEQEIVIGGSVAPVSLIAHSDNLYIKEDNNYIVFTRDMISTNEQIYYKLTISEMPSFYISGKFFYKDEEGNFLKDSINNSYVENREYYDIKESNITIMNPFYIPNKYYYLDGTNYLLDSSKIAIENREYFELEKAYVLSDNNGIYTRGMEWTIDSIPEGVILGKKAAKNELKELEGFARNFNTIHGLILRLNEIIEGYEEDTRDLTTAKGCINKLNDIIVKFDKLIPGQLLITNEYGQLANIKLEDLLFTEYSLDGNISGAIETGDTINSAFSKVENNITNLNSSLTEKINDDIATLKEELQKEIDDDVAALNSSLTKVDNNLKTDIENNKDAIETNANEIADINTRINNLIPEDYVIKIQSEQPEAIAGKNIIWIKI